MGQDRAEMQNSQAFGVKMQYSNDADGFTIIPDLCHLSDREICTFANVSECREELPL